MNRFSLAVAVAAILALVSAAPAFGWAVTPQDGAYVTPFDGTWSLVSNGEVVNVYDAAETPIPAQTSVWVATGWYGGAYGLIKSVPVTFEEKFTLDDTPVVPDFAAGKAIWSAVYPVSGTSDETFNPRMGVKLYGRDWWKAVDDDLLTVGPHHLVFTENVRHPVTDLLGGYDEYQHTPAFLPAGLSVYVVDFSVE